MVPSSCCVPAGSSFLYFLPILTKINTQQLLEGQSFEVFAQVVEHGTCCSDQPNMYKSVLFLMRAWIEYRVILVSVIQCSSLAPNAVTLLRNCKFFNLYEPLESSQY